MPVICLLCHSRLLYLPGWRECVLNRLFYGDNLEVLREQVAAQSVDLVYLDPPFNPNRSYNVIFGRSSTKGAAAAHAPPYIQASSSWRRCRRWTSSAKLRGEKRHCDKSAQPAVPLSGQLPRRGMDAGTESGNRILYYSQLISIGGWGLWT